MQVAKEGFIIRTRKTAEFHDIHSETVTHSYVPAVPHCPRTFRIRPWLMAGMSWPCECHTCWIYLTVCVPFATGILYLNYFYCSLKCFNNFSMPSPRRNGREIYSYYSGRLLFFLRVFNCHSARFVSIKAFIFSCCSFGSEWSKIVFKQYWRT